MQLQNDLLLKAARGEPTSRTPVWLMRQAGRIMPGYRRKRNQMKDFKHLLKTPDLAAEVTIEPVDLLGVDAAIIFSDILVVAEAMGLNYEMVEQKGPYFPKTIRNENDINTLRIAEPDSDLNYVYQAIRQTKSALNYRVPLIGFAGAPWTIFAYMVEGQGSKTFSNARKLLYQNPEFSHRLLEMITQSTIYYLEGQIRAGVNMIQIFDSWAGILSPDLYHDFSLKYVSKICDSITEVPVTVFAKGAFFSLESMAQLNCEVIGLDWNMDIHHSRQIIGPDKTLQGNLDPCALYGSMESIRHATKNMLDQFGPHRHIANLGHGVYPDTEFDKVKCFVDTVKEYSVVLTK